MASKRQSPGIGHNGGLPEHADIRTALAVEMIFADQEKALREKKKRARKRMESQGIILSDLTDLKSMEGMTASEIEQLFRRRWHLAGAIHADKYEQLDIFMPKPSAPAVRAAHYTLGLIAGLKGADLEVPPLVVGDDRQQMIDGHNEGRERRAAAEASLLNEALAPENEGKVADGTSGAVNKRAAEDFAKDTGADPLVVNGETYKTMRQANAARARLAANAAKDDPVVDAPVWKDFPTDNAEWSDEQRGVFRSWFDAQPDDQPIPIGVEYPGAVAEFRRLREENGEAEFEAKGAGPDDADNPDTNDAAPKPKVMTPDFHNWGEDWEDWTGPQKMEFKRWFDSLPADFVFSTTSDAAEAYYKVLAEEREAAAPPAPQTADTPDPKEVEAAAQKLKESGFVPPKAGRKPRNLAK